MGPKVLNFWYRKSGLQPLIGIIIARWVNVTGASWQPMSPWRWLVAIAIPLLVVNNGMKKKSLDLSGGIAGQSNSVIAALL